MFSSRSTSWIHQWSRPLIGGIALLGSLETAYLTLVKVLGKTAVCPVGRCNDVLNSSYGTLFGLPLTFWGCLAYTILAILALAPMVLQGDSSKSRNSDLAALNWWLMFTLSTAMAVFSGYLVYILTVELQVFCLYCTLSAIFSFSLFFLTLAGRAWEDIGQLIFRGLLVGMVTLIGVLGIYNQTSATEPSTITREAIAQKVSGSAEMDLAHHLTQIGAKQYGAYWCPHCQEQKQYFGQAAFNLIQYIECDPGGKDAQPQQCKDAGIKAYPTWEINGKLHTGLMTLEQLAKLSGYSSWRDFQ
ncbi:MAG: vitamin K epoxide reductase family protein [Microcoleaceae cyanobacterium]